jgi:hypothetical protein
METGSYNGIRECGGVVPWLATGWRSSVDFGSAVNEQRHHGHMTFRAFSRKFNLFRLVTPVPKLLHPSPNSYTRPQTCDQLFNAVRQLIYCSGDFQSLGHGTVLRSYKRDFQGKW